MLSIIIAATVVFVLFILFILLILLLFLWFVYFLLPQSFSSFRTSRFLTIFIPIDNNSNWVTMPALSCSSLDWMCNNFTVASRAVCTSVCCCVKPLVDCNRCTLKQRQWLLCSYYMLVLDFRISSSWVRPLISWSWVIVQN